MANVAIFRINYKSDFILTLSSDAGWMTPFCIKFWTAVPSIAYFVGYDGTTYTNCAPVEGEPTKLRVQFDNHGLPIGELQFQIGYHFTVADFPTAIEDEVINQAAVIIDQDGTPMHVMLDFTGETAPEIQFSLPAYANEAQRIANEQVRIANEQQRIANEEQRIHDEEVRQLNEAQRIQNENARVSEFARLKRESESATTAANEAASQAEAAARLAAEKALLAEEASRLAGEKAQLAAAKAQLAADAAALANAKAALANEKAAYAKSQGDYAKSQGDISAADHRVAVQDHQTAVDDHTQAGNDHTRAESDHRTATDDHTTAGTDHTRAESDHTRAGEDHTRAGEDHTRAGEDHTRAGNDHTRAESDHTRAGEDHTQAGNDHTRAGEDHTRAGEDHTRAEADHAAVEVFIDSLGTFDLSKYNAVEGQLATYADLDAALTALAALPSQYKYGGMSFKFVNTSDNKYVQWRLKKKTWTTDISEWEKIQNIVNPINNFRSGSISRGSLIDMNDAEVNQYYMLQIGDATGKSTISNLPNDMPTDGLAWYALTLQFNNGNIDSRIQFLFKNNLTYIYRRQKEGSTWYSWRRVMNISSLEELLANAMIVSPIANIRTGNNRLGSLSDMNDAEDNQYNMIQVDATGKSTIANLPADMPADGLAWYALTLSFKGVGDADTKVQYIFRNDYSYIFRRQKEGSTWYSWRRVMNISSLRKKIVVASDGSGNYIKFTDALAYAYSTGNVDIIVKNGTYYITDEIDIENAGKGPTIGNGTRIYCESNVNIVCEYTGSNTTTKSNFSVLNAGEGDYEIHDINIKCKNIRYCVHDERSTDAAPYHHKYINCYMVLDNTESNWDSPQCIGGGLGCYGIIEVDGGYYEGLPHVGDNHYGEISYHNTSASISKSKITIKNVYFANNTFRAGYHGSSTDITDCFVNGCSMPIQPMVRAETGSSTVVNMRLYAWGNEIRNGQ